MKNLLTITAYSILFALACAACDSSSSKSASADASLDPGVDAALLHKPRYATNLTPAILDGGAKLDATADAQAQSGPCAGVDCSALSVGCNVGYCDATTGACKTRQAGDDAPCDDGDGCSVGDVCIKGVCKGGKVDCSALDDACNVGTCDKASARCKATPRADGTKCDDASVCTTSDHCKAGACVGSALDCSGSLSKCHAAACDPKSGCNSVPLTGAACDDTDPCTVDDTCAAGTCAGSALDCSPFAGPCSTAACIPGVGGCKVTVKSDGASCEDGTKCTTGDTCSSGNCIGTVKACPAATSRCQVPSCDAATGDCGVVNAVDGIQCDDADGCSVGDHCQSGVCTGSPKVCPAATCKQASCQSPAGTCVQTPAANGTSCDTDPSDCVTSTCQAGACQQAPHADCSACGGAAGLVCDPYATCGPETVLSTYDFDNGVGGVLAARFSTPGGSSSPWALTTSTAYAGTGALRSGVASDNQTSAIDVSVEGGPSTTLSFWVSMSSEAAHNGKPGDALVLLINGSEQKRWSGDVPWVLVSTGLAPGPNVVELAYVKDGSGSAGSDRALIDELQIADEAQPLSFAPGALAPLQTSGNVHFTVTSPNSAAAGGLGVGNQAVLTLPLGFSRTVSVGFRLNTTLASTDTLTVSYDGTTPYTFNYNQGPSAYWSLFDLPAGTSAVQWQLTRGAGSTSSPAVSVSEIALLPAACP